MGYEEVYHKVRRKISPTYMTKVEMYGEIPKPELICRMVDIFGYDRREFLNVAKQEKISRFKEALDEKYKKALEKNHLEKQRKH